MSARPLAGRTVLLLRPAGRARALVSRLEALGGIAEARPAIAFAPPQDAGPALGAIAELAGFDWLVFTSPTGVECFVERWRKAGGEPPRGRVAAIGPGTARALERAGLPVDLLAESSRSTGLAESLRREAPAGARILLVRPEVAGDVLSVELEAAGAEVHPVAFYRTVPAPGARAVADRIAERGFDAVVFTSPSTLGALLEAGGRGERLRERLREAKRVAIGPVTARALERAGLRADVVAAAPADDEIVAAVVHALGR